MQVTTRATIRYQKAGNLSDKQGSTEKKKDEKKKNSIPSGDQFACPRLTRTTIPERTNFSQALGKKVTTMTGKGWEGISLGDTVPEVLELVRTCP